LQKSVEWLNAQMIALVVLLTMQRAAKFIYLQVTPDPPREGSCPENATPLI